MTPRRKSYTAEYKLKAVEFAFPKSLVKKTEIFEKIFYPIDKPHPMYKPRLIHANLGYMNRKLVDKV